MRFNQTLFNCLHVSPLSPSESYKNVDKLTICARLAEAVSEYISSASQEHSNLGSEINMYDPIPSELGDQELLSMALWYSRSDHGNTASARELLDKFGDFSRVLAAPIGRLTNEGGLPLRVALNLKVFERFAKAYARSRLRSGPVLREWDMLEEYCHATVSYSEVQILRVVYIDGDFQLIADEELARGTIDFVRLYPRELLKRALALNASYVIAVRNNTFGGAEPKKMDLDFIRDLDSATRALGISLLEYVITSPSGINAMWAGARLPNSRGLQRVD